MLFDIIYQVTLPIIILVLIGYIPQKFLHLDSVSLNRFVVYILTPAFLVHAFSTAPMSFAVMGTTLWLITAQFFLLLGVGIVWMTICGVRGTEKRLGAFATAYPNSGNYGLPFIGLALGAEAVPIQGIAGSIHGILIMSVGLQFLAANRSHILHGVLAALKSPFTIAVLVGIAIKLSGIVLPHPITTPLEMVAKGFVPIAIIMLGVQLASTSFSRDWQAVLAIVFGSLIVAPIATALALWGVMMIGVRIDPLLIKLIILNGGLPIGVLLAMFAQQWGGQTQLASAVVLVSTALSPFTLTAAIWGLNQFPMP